MDEGAIEPLNVVVLGEQQKDLVTDYRERKEEDSASGFGQGERTQVHTERERERCIGLYF